MSIADIVKDRYRRSHKARSTTAIYEGASYDAWLGRLERAYHKVHEKEEIEAFPGMARYYGLTQTRIDAIAAWRKDMLINAEEAPFTLKPSPLPELPKRDMDEVTEAVARGAMLLLAQNGLTANDAADSMGLKKPVQRYAREIGAQLKKARAEAINKRAERDAVAASNVIADIMLMNGWTNEFSKFQFWHTFAPAAFMVMEEVEDWQDVWNGNKATRKQVRIPRVRCIDPRFAFISTDADNARTGGWFIERAKKSQGQLFDMLNMPAYKEAVVKEIILKFQTRARNWLLDLEQENKTLRPDKPWDDDEDIDVLIMWGKISGRELKMHGETGVEDWQMYECRVEMIGDDVVSCVRAKYTNRPRSAYSSTWSGGAVGPYSASPGMMMWDAQLALNRLQYFIYSNAYAAHNGMAGINAGRLKTPETFSWEPGGSFLHKAEAAITTGERNALDIYTMPATYGNMLQLFIQRMKLVDDEVGVSSVSYGSNFTTQQDATLGAQLLRVTGSGRGLKSALDSQDKQLIEPVIGDKYRLLREAGKVTGDAMPKARGAAGIMQKEMQALQVKEDTQLVAQAASTNPDKYGAAYDHILSQRLMALGVPEELIPQSPELEAEAKNVLRGIPATPQVKADGRSMFAGRQTTP